jgi:4-amino-4-deoxy-L-arabinose transferase-like glycosyltransferase
MTPAIEGQDPGSAAPPRPTEPPDAPAAPLWKMPTLSISLETVVWLAIIGLAAALRLARLEHLPLTVDESVRALASWQTSEGDVPGNWTGDMTQAVTAYLFAVFGAGDLLARLLPALLGCLAVALFWPLARHVGGAALLAAVLVAFSPLLVHVSRSGLPYAAGAALSLAMVAAFFTFVKTRSPVSLFALALATGLALASDPIATSTAILLLVFLALEATTSRSPAIGEALDQVRRSPALALSALVIFLGGLELGVTRFGTDINRLSLPGLRLWIDMFDLPRDSLPWHFHPGLLISYEAPVFILGTVGYLWVLYRWLTTSPDKIGVPLFQRFLVVWASGAALIIAVITRREAGQLVLLLLPLALLAGCWLEALLAELNLASLVRSLPFLTPVLFAVGYATLELTEWARDRDVNRSALILVAGGSIALLWLAWNSLGRRAISGYLVLISLVSLVFLVHGATSVAYGRGSEFLADQRLDRQLPRLEKQLAAMGGEQGTVAADMSFLPTLGWYLRDVPGLVFVSAPPAEAKAFLGVAGQPAPAGYRVDRRWPIAQGWVPRTVDPLDWWRWLVYRESFGSLTSTEADLLVKGP